MMTNGRPEVRGSAQRPGSHARKRGIPKRNGLASGGLTRRGQTRNGETARTWPDGPDRLARTVAATCRLLGQLTRGRLTDAHDEVLYVIRKPEEHFARVV